MTTIPPICEKLREHFYQLPAGFYSDEDYGCNEDYPLSLLMAILDHGPEGKRLMEELTASGYSFVKTEVVNKAASQIIALVSALEPFAVGDPASIREHHLIDAERAYKAAMSSNTQGANT